MVKMIYQNKRKGKKESPRLTQASLMSILIGYPKVGPYDEPLILSVSLLEILEVLPTKVMLWLL